MRKTQLESQHLLIYPPKNNAHYSCVCVSNLYFICIECVCDIHVNAIINFIYTHALVKDTRTHAHSYLYTHTHTELRKYKTYSCRRTSEHTKTNYMPQWLHFTTPLSFSRPAENNRSHVQGDATRRYPKFNWRRGVKQWNN